MTSRPLLFLHLFAPQTPEGRESLPRPLSALWGSWREKGWSLCGRPQEVVRHRGTLRRQLSSTTRPDILTNG